MTTGKQVFDYIVVGAGSAGCVVASRLTEDADVRVLLLEAGGRDSSVYIHMPGAVGNVYTSKKLSWPYRSEREPQLNNRRVDCPRGRVVGGSSSINGMTYVRGHALDYERWARDGLPGWDYRHVLPYFRKAEAYRKGADEYRGGDGPLHVMTGECSNPVMQAWLEAGRQAGYPVTADMNGFQQEGFGRMDMTVHRGRRCSTSVAYLRPARKRPNLVIWTGAHANRVLIERKRAVGVEVARGNTVQQVRAERGVLLSGGAVNSPQLLMLSGIGPADSLRRCGLQVVLDLPGVGQNLQDHLEVLLQHACAKPVTPRYPMNAWRRAMTGLSWALFRSGPGATSHFEAGGFIRSRAGVEHPDLQYHLLPVAVRSNVAHGFQVHISPMRSQSRGDITLRSANPRAAPRIRFNYLSHAADFEEFRSGIRLTREILAQPAFDKLRGPELAPGPATQTDSEIDAFVREHADTCHHFSSSCRMGHDSGAVVDGEARVHGVEGLRVVDASIMPSIVSGNLNGPTIMLAEKLADSIRGRPPLGPSEAPVWLSPHWRTAQR